MIRNILPAGVLVLTLGGANAGAVEYKGLCEASAGAFLDDTHFVVASDETNRLQLYQRGKPDPIGDGIDMKPFTSFEKSDLEAAAAVGDRIYWISSHSLNSKGKDQPKRKIFFATKIGSLDGKPTLTGIGSPVTNLRDTLAKSAGASAGELNIEALAATPQGGLLIGLRAPLRAGKALVIPFSNPGPVVDRGAPPDIGEAVAIDLKGLGLRSMDLIPGTAGYIIIAGPISDSDGFMAFRWAGPGTTPEEIKDVNLTGIRPEGAMVVPGQNIVQLLSDDGDVCSDEDDPPAQRRFRSIDIGPKNLRQ
ncbi:MAG: hypothetical protein JWQ17_6684 [Tardiphaga sp.]|jgi:hypothetical protein|nr:hypothetical protein [Tardiphaga sp.]